MTPDQAFFNVVQDYVPGVKALAESIGRAYQTLLNKANPNMPTHEPTLSDVRKVTTVTSDLRVIEALAAEQGAVVVRLPEVPDCSRQDLLQHVLTCNKEFADVFAELQEDMRDGKLRAHEFERLQVQVNESIAAHLELLEQARSMVVERARVVGLRGVSRG
ncbi:phage regulatory CII family protein [Methyloversatilis sp.]|uniref:phage regulatory CII family protein n=1 Tax=Methyloversatilis sp. TaxID=2569862 RepID=UPI0035AF7424